MGAKRSRRGKTSKAASNKKEEKTENEPIIQEVETESSTTVNEEMLGDAKDSPAVEEVPAEPNPIVQEKILDGAEEDISAVEQEPIETNPTVDKELLAEDKEDDTTTPELLTEDKEDDTTTPELLTEDKEDDTTAPELLTEDKEDDTTTPELLTEDKEDDTTTPELLTKDKEDDTTTPELLTEDKEDDTTTPDSVNRDKESSSPSDAPPHPYAEAIEKCPCHDWQLEKKEPEPLTTLEETQFTMVTSKEDLGMALSRLKLVKEIAVSIKRDRVMSSKGKNYLVQISTRIEDFFIDCIALKDSLHMLNGVFTDSDILKVMYKAENILSSLQHDFTVYLVNLFDLHIASRDLGSKNEKLHQKSLSTILKELCSVELPYKKQGWHEYDIRPLPADHVNYARQETHYMLHAKDKLQNMLIKNNILKQFYTQCNDICKILSQGDQDLQHTRFKPEDYKSLLHNGGTDMSKSQKEVIRLLFAWRYEAAMANDKGPLYVMPDESLLIIAHDMPKDIHEIQGCLKDHSISPILEKDLDIILKLILKAKKDFPNTKPTVGSSAKRKFGFGNSANENQKWRKTTTSSGIRDNFVVGRCQVNPIMGPQIRPRMPALMRPNSMMRSNSMMRPRMRPPMQSSTNMGLRVMKGPRMGRTIPQPPWERNSINDQRMGPRMGSGMVPRMGSGMGPQMGSGMVPRMGSGMGPQMGSRMGPRMGAGMALATGSGIGQRTGLGMGLGIGPGIGQRIGPGMGRRVPQKTGPRMGVGMGMGSGIRNHGTPQMNQNRERIHNALASVIAKVIVDHKRR